MKKTEFKRIRKQLGWTLNQAGEELGVHWNSVWRYENGERAIPLPVARLLQRLVAEHEVQRGAHL